MNIAATVGASLFRKGAVEGANYAVKAIGGELASRELFAMRDGVAAKVAPYAGKALGKIAGAIVAGDAIPFVKKEHDAFVGSAGAAVEALTATAGANQAGNQKSSLITKSIAVGKAVALAGVFAAGATGVLPVASLACAYAVATAVPQIGQAIANAPEAGNEHNFIDNVVKPIGVQAFQEVASIGLNKYVQFKWLENSYFARIVQGKEIGKRIGAYFPTSISKYFEKAGEIAGRIDAGRYTWTDTNVASAQTAGDLSGAFAKTAIGVGRGALTQAPQTNGVVDLARKTVIVVGTAASLGAMAFFLPSVAATVGPALAIGAIANGVSHFRAKAPAAVQPKVEVVVEKVEPAKTEPTKNELPVTVEKTGNTFDEIIANLRPQAETVRPAVEMVD